MVLFFIFFMQKTAYEMRISDWSSDVCSSDLIAAVFFVHPTSYYSRSSWNATLEDRDSDHRANLFVQGMASAFADAGEIWAPRYRQATIGAFLAPDRVTAETGSASGRERGGQYV